MSFRNRQNSEPLASFSGLFRSEYKCILYLTTMYVYCVYPAMSKKSEKLVRFKQKGQKQASFLAFHKCCQGCLLPGPCYISTSFILVCALCCTQLQGTRKVYSQAEKFIRLVRIKQTFIRIAYLYSKCTNCSINVYMLIDNMVLALIENFEIQDNLQLLF